MLDIAVELKRVRRVRRLLEPLAVLYEKAVMDARKWPFVSIYIVAHAKPSGFSHSRQLKSVRPTILVMFVRYRDILGVGNNI